jgi:PAS domain S-box-containing protein
LKTVDSPNDLDLAHPQSAAPAAASEAVAGRERPEVSPACLIAILECTTDLACISDPSGHVLYLNRSARSLLGVGAGEDITKITTRDIVKGPAGDRGLREGIPAALRDGTWRGESVLLTRSGREIPVSQVILAHKAPSGSLDFLSMVMRDVSDRSQSETARTQMAAIVDSSDDAIIAKDLNGVVTTWNRGAERIFGYTAREMMGASIMRIIPAGREAEESTILGKIRRGESTEHFETIRQTKDGRMIHISLTASPIRDDAGNMIGVSKVARDITARLLLEDQFRQAQKMEAIGTLAGGIAHDFNNILSAIVGNIELAQIDLTGNPKVRKYLAGTMKATWRAAALVRQILTFSRQQPQNRIPILLGPVLAECASLLRATVPTTIEFELSFAEDAPIVLADANQVQQVIMNLGTNAWYAMKDRIGKFELKLERFVADGAPSTVPPALGAGVYAHISVRDTGCGMDADTLRRVFEPFFTTKPLGEGTGLGLSVVHGIMQGHEGAISVESHPGEGTVFHLYFPAYDGVATEAAIEEKTVPLGHGERILVVDDEELLATLGESMLSALGYEAECMTEPAAAVAAVRANPLRYALVLTDQSMPGMTGVDLATQLKAIRPGLPMILMSGYAASLTRERIRTAGIGQVLLKPITIRSLQAAVFAALTAKPATDRVGRGSSGSRAPWQKKQAGKPDPLS